MVRPWRTWLRDVSKPNLIILRICRQSVKQNLKGFGAQLQDHASFSREVFFKNRFHANDIARV